MIYNFSLKYSPEAIEQIIYIVKWYNSKSNGLGSRFKSNLKLALQITKKNPYTHSCRYENVRFTIPNKFPYAAHYTIDETNNCIIIHGVFAFAESPDKWIK